MSRTIYTERDIEDLAKQGIKEIKVNETIYITDIAREKMEVLGIKTKTVQSRTAPASQVSASTAALTVEHSPPGESLSDAEKQQVIEKVKSGVIARLGPEVDAALLETIVRRVVSQL